MEREKAKVLVEVELDPIPGAMHTAESAKEFVEYLLISSMGPYAPKVSLIEERGDKIVNATIYSDVVCTCGQGDDAAGHFLRCAIWKAALGDRIEP